MIFEQVNAVARAEQGFSALFLIFSPENFFEKVILTGFFVIFLDIDDDVWYN